MLADIPAATLARLGSTAITHYIYFDTLQQRDDCAAQLLQRGLTVLPEAQHLSEIGIFRVRVSQHDAISHNAIYDMIEQIIVVTQKFGITYSHWNLMMRKSFTRTSQMMSSYTSPRKSRQK